MIEYFLHTGENSTGSIFYNKGQVFNGIASVFNNNILDNDITVNGQTFLETIPSIQSVGQQEIITNSGQFFLSGGILRSSTGFLDVNLSKAVLKYDQNLSGVRLFHQSSVHEDLITGFSGKFEGGSVYLNGVKLTSGIHYIEDSNSNFEWIDPNNTITGVLFSAPKRDFLRSTGSYDILNIDFNEGSNIGYLNGVKIDETSLLEVSSLLSNSIQTGLTPVVEFSIPQNLNSFFL